jgi:hypothetical protein
VGVVASRRGDHTAYVRLYGYRLSLRFRSGRVPRSSARTLRYTSVSADRRLRTRARPDDRRHVGRRV